MPNPKVGTVTDDIQKAVTEAKAGKVEYRTDRQAIVHMAIGKASFDATKLLDNYTTVIEEIIRAKPASAKGKYILSCTLATSMGPGIRVDTTKSAERELVGAGAGETAAEPANA
jgi:large subunit ribosomal protein L1